MGVEVFLAVLEGLALITVTTLGGSLAFKITGAAVSSLGTVLVFCGAVLVVILGGYGSAVGIRISGSQAAGVLSEKPELFGKMFVIMALPGTQGFYSFVCGIMIVVLSGVTRGGPPISLGKGIALLAVGVCVGIIERQSAIYQGQSSAAAESLVGRQPSSSGQAILIPALVETYAVIGLVSGILLILWISQAAF